MGCEGINESGRSSTPTLDASVRPLAITITEWPSVQAPYIEEARYGPMPGNSFDTLRTPLGYAVRCLLKRLSGRAIVAGIPIIR